MEEGVSQKIGEALNYYFWTYGWEIKVFDLPPVQSMIFELAQHYEGVGKMGGGGLKLYFWFRGGEFSFL